VAAGVVVLLADLAAGAAVVSTLARGFRAPTLQLHVELARHVRAEPGRLVARGELVHGDAASLLGGCDVLDRGGGLVARATTRCLNISVPADTGEDQLAGITPPALDARSPQPDVGSPSVAELVGAEVVSAAEGRARLRAPAAPWLANTLGMATGGAMGLLAETTMAVALRTALDASQPTACLDLQLWFARPVVLTGADVVVDATARHVGRRTAIVTAELATSDGRPALHASASYAVSPAARGDAG
jgi:uncharacterized protein (TIGR00369 family)